MRLMRQVPLWTLAACLCIPILGCGSKKNDRGSKAPSASITDSDSDDAVEKKKKRYKKPIDDHDHEPSLDPDQVEKNDGGEQPGTSDQPPADNPQDNPSVPEVARLTTAVGVKNFRQINATMSALTGIPTTNTVVAPVYTQLASQLPDTNDIRSLLASHQVAITKLAVEYCDQMVVTPAALNSVLPGINLNVPATTALNATGREAINKALIVRFWGSGLSTTPDMNASLTTMSKLTDELLAGKNQNNAALTPNIVKALCTAVLASAPVTFH